MSFLKLISDAPKNSFLRAGSVAQAVECETLSSNLSTAKKKKKNRRRSRRRRRKGEGKK
jgi:hypothetical protein